MWDATLARTRTRTSRPTLPSPCALVRHWVLRAAGALAELPIAALIRQMSLVRTQKRPHVRGSLSTAGAGVCRPRIVLLARRNARSSVSGRGFVGCLPVRYPPAPVPARLRCFGSLRRDRWSYLGKVPDVGLCEARPHPHRSAEDSSSTATSGLLYIYSDSSADSFGRTADEMPARVDPRHGSARAGI